MKEKNKKNGSELFIAEKKTPDRFLLRLAIGLWIALAVAVCVKSIVQQGRHSVYPVYAWGSRHWWADQPLHADYPELNIDIYRYSPTCAIIFTPFALLPDWLGASLWGILSIAITLCALRAMVRELLPGSWPPRREAWFLGLTALGSMSGIWSGQSNSLLLAFVIFASVAIKRQRWWTASLLLALPVFIKIWPIAVVFLLSAFWPKKLPWRFAIVAVALALLPFLTRPFSTVAGQYQEWYVSLTGPQQDRWSGFRDAWTIWENLWPPVSRHGYQVLQLASAFLVLLWCVYQRRRIKNLFQTFPLALKQGQSHHFSPLPLGERQTHNPSPLPLGEGQGEGYFLTLLISIWASWQLLFGPGAEQLTYGLIAPSAAWAVLVSVAEKRHRVWTTLTWLILALLCCGEFETPLLRLHPGFAMLLPLGVASFAIWLIYHERGTIEHV